MAFLPAPGTLTVTVETQWLPTFTVGLIGAAQAAGAAPFVATKILKPKLTIRSGDTILTTWAPAGDPGKSKWPWLLLGVLVVGGFVVTRLVGR